MSAVPHKVSAAIAKKVSDAATAHGFVLGHGHVIMTMACFIFSHRAIDVHASRDSVDFEIASAHDHMACADHDVCARAYCYRFAHCHGHDHGHLHV